MHTCRLRNNRDSCSFAAAHAIAEECEASGVVCSVVGVPKSIDNDILLVR
jgi:6-phosphofructokinase